MAKKRKYTGTSDGASAGKRAGLEEFVRQINKWSDGALWNNGTWMVRSKMGKTSLSVHATGRAVDLSYRKLGCQRQGRWQATRKTRHTDAHSKPRRTRLRVHPRLLPATTWSRLAMRQTILDQVHKTHNHRCTRRGLDTRRTVTRSSRLTT
jgi:hypothetical protein